MREPEWVLRVTWKLEVDVAWPSLFRGLRFQNGCRDGQSYLFSVWIFFPARTSDR
jgi:hypothetical protein